MYIQETIELFFCSHEQKKKQKFNIEIDRKKLVNFSPINLLGTATVKVELYKDVVATIRVIVKDKE
mgnify:CR=1 FL=1